MNASGAPPTGSLHGVGAVVPLAALARASSLSGALEALRDRTVIIASREQLAAALALIELDGVARRMVLCPPDLAAEHFPAVIEQVGADAWVGDSTAPEASREGLEVQVTIDPRLSSPLTQRRTSHATEWVLLTSGTTGVPKSVLHTFASLTDALTRRPIARGAILWSTFYDIRRYGGLQIFLRAMHSGSLLLSSRGEPVVDFLARAGAAGITHISGTPSHWRGALMSGATARIAPRYVRLSGEIADQAILDGLHAAFPEAGIAHAFASTEAGVAFEVGDGLAGFPASLVGAPGPVEIKIENGTLRVRSPGNALRYLGAHAPLLRLEEGFVDTGDRVELREGRYYFIGRSGGVINVGGLKVHPEEVEAVINTHPWVQMSLVRARRSPITGAVVTAEVVLADATAAAAARPGEAELKQEIIEVCRRGLAAHKVPAMVRIVPSLEVSPSGKLVRPNA